MVEMEVRLKVQLEARWAEAEVERRGNWNFPRQCERLGQRLMVQHRVEVEELVVRVPLEEGEEPGQQREQMGEAPDLMRQEEEVEGQKVFEMQEAAELAGPCLLQGVVEELVGEGPRGPL